MHSLFKPVLNAVYIADTESIFHYRIKGLEDVGITITRQKGSDQVEIYGYECHAGSEVFSWSCTEANIGKSLQDAAHAISLWELRNQELYNIWEESRSS